MNYAMTLFINNYSVSNMDYNTETNIADNLTQHFVEQGLTIKEGETRSFILTKSDDTITDDLISTYDERETTKVIYA